MNSAISFFSMILSNSLFSLACKVVVWLVRLRSFKFQGPLTPNTNQIEQNELYASDSTRCYLRELSADSTMQRNHDLLCFVSERDVDVLSKLFSKRGVVV